MTTRRLMLLAFGWALLATSAVADEPPPPSDLPEPAPADLPEDQPKAVQPVPVAVPVPAVAVPVATAVPSVVGEYRVGHVHDAPWSHIHTYHSFFNPFVQEVFRPVYRELFYDNHAPYYVRYRTIYNSPDFGQMYVPNPYAANPYAAANCPPQPGVASANAGDAAGRAGYGFPVHQPAYQGAGSAQGGEPTGYGPQGYAPYGAGSAAYFGNYGAGY